MMESNVLPPQTLYEDGLTSKYDKDFISPIQTAYSAGNLGAKRIDFPVFTSYVTIRKRLNNSIKKDHINTRTKYIS